MPPDYPDWMAGNNPNQGARRSVLNVIGGETGSVIWSTSFEDGLADVDQIPDHDNPVLLTSLCAYSGGVSVKMLPTVATAYAAGVKKRGIPFSSGRLGVETFFRPSYLSANGYQSFYINFGVNNNLWPDGSVKGSMRIYRDATHDGVVEIYTPGGWVEIAGANIPNFFEQSGIAHGDYYFHQFKLVVDAKNEDPMYVRLMLDGIEHDLSAHEAFRVPGVFSERDISIGAFLWIPDADPACGYLDCLTVTEDEP